MAARSLVATPVALRAPAVNRARGRASLRCSAAAKGIAGDGRVKLCLSKEEFDAANAEAGDNLVRDLPCAACDTLAEVARARARLDKHSQRAWIFRGLRFFATAAPIDRNVCAFPVFRSSKLTRDDPADAIRLLQVAVQISTKTCGPCKVVYPHFAALSEELTDVTFCKIMGDHDADTRALMKEWGVRVVPLFMLFRNGEKVTEWSGAKPDVLRENVLEGCTEAEKASIVSA